jgi:predicted Zn-dependent protease
LYENDYQLEFWRGVLSTLNYDLTKALPAFQKSIQLNPEYPRSHQELAEVYLEQAKFEEARTEYRWLVDRFPDNSEYVTGYARSLLNLGYPEQAAEQLGKLKEILKLPSPELALVCETNLEAGKVQEASEQAAVLLQRWPDALPYLQLQARCMAKLGNPSESQALFSKAAISQTKRPDVDRLLEKLGVDGANHALRMELGELMMTYLDPSGGIGYIQVASRSVPNDLRGHELLAIYYEREGRSTLADVHRRAVQQLELAKQEQEERERFEKEQGPLQPPVLVPSASIP